MQLSDINIIILIIITYGIFLKGNYNNNEKYSVLNTDIINAHWLKKMLI